jgi:rare lipoprotein A (peptidoglycan hydrolase)
MDQSRYGNSGNTSPLCGQQVQITNQINGNTVVVTIADDCPTCQNSNSIDLSVAAFQALDDLSVGDLPSTSCLITMFNDPELT